ncbi:phage tail tape measure protein [Pseudomonas sp. PS02290]|uniref:phage tail tape measure protein n=1 Tax=Pseudomonas sp. PS02290 TaxID=2991430 RepID=UPI00249C497A|nr:phage tail tape measure protein [Pseudomonas sp. PS02290]
MADKFQLKALITGADKLSPMLAGIQKNISGFRKNLQATGLGSIGFREAITGGALAAPFVVGTHAAIQFESAMADVRKVVNFDTPKQFQEMGDDITKMSTRLPMAATDIAKIVAAGGQAGIARGELRGFAEDAVKMGIAFDQSAEDSGQMMATWRTAFAMTQPEVVTLADKINYLGNTGPANAQKISAIVTRIGPMGRVAGVASGQIAALGATLGGMGVEQEIASTAIKNLMVTMTQGAAATKSQQQAFKSLRLDAKSVSKAMQMNGQGTILQLLDRIKGVRPDAQLSVLTQLFGTESAPALAMLLTNLDLLKGNLNKVSDAQKYGGSMEAEYASRAATTENNLKLMGGALMRNSIMLGNAFLPALNAVVVALQPLVNGVGDFIRDNPNLVQGIAAAAVAFTILRVGIIGAVVATKLLSLALRANPIGLVASAIAVAVGIIVANWDKLAPFFTELWGDIQSTFAKVWPWIKSLLAWTPLALIIANWDGLVTYFAQLWGRVVATISTVWPWIKKALSWLPMSVIVQNWDAVKVFFSALWDFIKVAAEVGWNRIKEQIGFDPVQMVTEKWEPLVAWFKGFFDRIKPYIEPLMDAGKWVNGKAAGAADWVKGKASGVADYFSSNDPNAVGAGLLGRGTAGLQGATQSLLAGGNKTQLQGEMVMRFEGAPPGLRVEPAKTNQPGLTVTPSVGYRSLSGAQ